jgi:hypothetical protein
MPNAKEHQMKHRIILLLLIFFTLSSCGQNMIPPNFVETQQPKSNSSEKRELNYSEDEFDVRILNNKLEVNKTESNNKSVLKISNGTLVGSNHGEWGGKLIFIPDDKNQSEIVIKEGNLKFVFLFQNNIYFIEGLAHGSFNYGDLYQLNYSENKFTYKSIIHFEDSPEAYSIYKNKIYIVGYQNFYRIDNLKKEVIFKDAFWSGLYPSSIAIIDEKNVYLGIRSGIAKLNLTQRQIVFYKYIKH